MFFKIANIFTLRRSEMLQETPGTLTCEGLSEMVPALGDIDLISDSISILGEAYRYNKITPLFI
jgi:hypothetical protein